MKIIEKIIDVTTGEETVFERNETQLETENRLAVEAELASRLAVEAELASRKLAILNKLGITEEEAKLLLQ